MPDHHMAELLQPQAWAIEPGRLNNLLMTLRKNAGIFGPANEPERTYELDGNLAIIKISGPLSRYSWWGSSFNAIRQAVSDALADPKVAGILLNVNSPGGTVAGTMELAHYLRQAGEQKPLHAYVDGLMASAAYWICSSAKTIAAPATADIGSIGVVMVHADWSKNNEEFGVNITYMHAGAYKVAGNPNTPLSDADREYFMQGIGGTYQLFVDAVAQGRGLDADAVKATEARVYLAAEAKEQGLIDRVVADIDEFVTQIKEELDMNLEQLRAQYPELVKAVEDSARAGFVSEADAGARAEQAAAAATEQAATAERTRVMGVVGVLVGETGAAKIQAVVDSGATPEMITAFQGLQGGANTDAQPAGDQGQGAAAAILGALQNAATPPLGTGTAGAGTTPGDDKDFKALVDEHRETNKCSLAEAQRAVAAKWPDKHKAYIDAANKEG